MAPKEVICIQVGGAGNRIGLSAWEQLLREHEHKLFPDQFTTEEKQRRFHYQQLLDDDENFRSVFRENKEGKFIPLTLFIDLERPHLTLSELSDSTGENLLQMIRDYESECSESGSLFVSLDNNLENSCKTFANGRYSSHSKKLLELSMERIRGLVEKCDSFSKFSILLVSSVGGGVGSGFVNLLMDQLYSTYQKTFKCAICICPDTQQGDSSMVESLNSLLYMGCSSTNGWDAKIVMENKAISKLCQKEFQYTSMDSLNELISLTISNITVSNRFESSSSIDLQNLTTNLPYPILNNYYPFFGPIHSSMKTVPHDYGTEMFTYDALSSPLIESKLSAGYVMSCSLLYRGYVEPRTINSVIRQVKENKTIKFCDWAIGAKVGAEFHRPLYSRNSNLLNMGITVSMLANSTGLKSSLERIKEETQEVFSRKSLLNHFHYEGMEKAEIDELIEYFDDIVLAYQEIDAYEELGPDESED